MERKGIRVNRYLSDKGVCSRRAADFPVKPACVVAGTAGVKCFDCKSPERICKALMVFWERPNGIPDTEVVLIDEDLGY